MTSNSISAVKRMKEMMKAKLDKEYPEKTKPIYQAREKYLVDRMKIIKKELVTYIEKKYPELKEVEKCAYNPSIVAANSLRLSFNSSYTDKIESDLHTQLKIVEIDYQVKLKKLDAWEFEAVNAIARKQDLPEIDLS